MPDLFISAHNTLRISVQLYYELCALNIPILKPYVSEERKLNREVNKLLACAAHLYSKLRFSLLHNMHHNKHFLFYISV